MHTALPETYVVTVNSQSSDGYVREPVVLWQDDGTKAPQPITMNGLNQVLRGAAILFSCGYVTDPNSGRTFENVETWLESNPETAPGAKREPAGRATKPSEVPEGPEAGSGGAHDIEWTDKPFKTNSFWHYDDGEHDFVFQVDGGENPPKASAKVTKIKRDDFMTMKKKVDVLTIDEIMNADPLPAPETGEDEDEDGGNDLI